jgi:hypothetical protein
MKFLLALFELISSTAVFRNEGLVMLREIKCFFEFFLAIVQYLKALLS